MVEERAQADLFAIQVDAIVNPVNCKGVMGKGIALEVKKRWPRSFKAYKLACDTGWLRPGKLLYIPGEAGEPNIIHFPTKDHWKDRSRLEWIRDGLGYLRRHYSDWGLRSLA